jgi:uncharacterized protein HemX
MGFLSSIISGLGFRGIAIIAVALALGGWGYYKTNQVVKVQTELATAIRDRDAAATARDKALEANKVSAATIASLKKEKADIQTALNNLANDRKKNQQALNELTAAINAQKADPANQVTLSPAVKMTVDTIQKQRDARRAK